MKRHHIIHIIIGVSIIVIVLLFMIILPHIGYSSPEIALWLNPSVQCYEIYHTIESNECFLVLYKGKSANKSETLYMKNGRYLIYDYSIPSIVFEQTSKGMVIVREVNGKYTIEISGIQNKISIEKVTDSISSSFEYYLWEYNTATTQKWFLALDEIPNNYCIYLDDLAVPIPIPKD